MYIQVYYPVFHKSCVYLKCNTAHLDIVAWEYEFNEGEQPHKRQLKLHRARGDEGTETRWKDDCDKSFDGYQHDGVDTQVERQVVDNRVDTTVNS